MSSMANGDIKTMNPADKFMTPRAPPPPPKLARLNTSTSVLTKERTTRSLSPTSERPQWSPRMFFGLLSSNSSSLDPEKRGRSSSLSKVQAAGSASTPSLALRSEEMRKVKSVPHTREVSPQSFKKTSSREPSPLRQLFSQESNTYNSAPLVIPDEIAEEVEDDDNFASQLSRMSINEKGIITPLSPPPSSFRSAGRAKTATNTSKPLPQLPEDFPLMPPPLRLRSAISAAELPRSHFSTSTISTTITSPTDSSFSLGEEESNEDEDLTADVGSGDEFTYSPVLSETPAPGFSGYSLPEDTFTSEQTIRKDASPLTQSSSQATFGAAPPFLPDPVPDAESMSTLEQLLHDMGYLGDAIVGK